MFAGINTHKDTLAVAVIDDVGRLLASVEAANTEPGFAAIVELLEAHGCGAGRNRGVGKFRPGGRHPSGGVPDPGPAGFGGRGPDGDDSTRTPCAAEQR